jgi:hypothetical protein
MDGNLDARCGSRRGFGFGGGGSCGAMGTKSQKPTELNWPVSSKPIKAPPHPRPVFCFFRASSGVCVLGIGHWPLAIGRRQQPVFVFVLCALCFVHPLLLLLLLVGAWRLALGWSSPEEQEGSLADVGRWTRNGASRARARASSEQRARRTARSLWRRRTRPRHTPGPPGPGLEEVARGGRRLGGSGLREASAGASQPCCQEGALSMAIEGW